MWLLVLVVAVAVANCEEPPPPFQDRCILEDHQNLYDPSHANQVPWYAVDLDEEPLHRWTHIATLYADRIRDLLDALKALIVPVAPHAIEWVDRVFAELHTKLPQPYKDELQGIAEATGIPVGEVTLYNVFYEIFTVCTSIVAEDPSGKIYHARNLDFGLFLGWNPQTHEWAITEKLRGMVINLNWVKQGRVLFKSNNFAGFVGIYNGLKQNAFSITANERFNIEGGYLGIIDWLTGVEPDGQWMTWHVRDVLTTATSYDEAFQRLSSDPILSPVYYILGGKRHNEGSIITRALNHTVAVVQLNATLLNPHGWYVLQTNYDPDKEPLYLDDRRTPGNHCMQVLRRQNVGFQGIYNVLSSKTTLNMLTTYTVLMQVDSGQFETHLQTCPAPCWAF